MWNIFVGNCEIWKYWIMISSQFFLKKMNPRKLTLCPWKRGWFEDHFHFVPQSDSSWTMVVGCFWIPYPYLTPVKKRGTHWNKTTVVGWLIPSWWCFKYPVVSSRKSKGYTLHNHPKDQFPNHLFGWLDFHGKQTSLSPPGDELMFHGPPNKDIPFNFITNQKQQPKQQKLSSQQLFLVTNICPKPKPKNVCHFPSPKKNQPNFWVHSDSRQPPSKTNICRGVSFRSLASRISDPRRGDEVGWWRWLVVSCWFGFEG